MNPRTVIAVAIVAVVAIPLSILLLLDPASSQGACGAVSGSGPSSVPGVPQDLLSTFENAAAQFNLGSDGWAYLAALNQDESQFDTSNLPGVHSGTNSAGAAGPMQIGVGGKATDNWDTVVDEIPAGIAGGTSPPSVYDETDAVYGGAALLSRWGAPGDWLKALKAWNDYPPEINTVLQDVAQWTSTATGSSSSTGTGTSTTGNTGGQVIVSASGTGVSTTESGSGDCSTPTDGPTVSGQTSTIESDGLAAIPSGAPEAVKALISAGNQIIDKPYPVPDQHYDDGSLTQLWPAYDCSGSVSYVLYKAGLMSSTALVAQEFESWGDAGAGQWITIYANDGHVFLEVAGIVLNTAHYSATTPAGTGPRWQPASTIALQVAGDNIGFTLNGVHHDGFVERHPAGL